MGQEQITELPRVLGVDPASKNVGIAVVEGTELIFSEQLEIIKGDTTEALALALSDFTQEIGRWLRVYQPSLLVLENTSVQRNVNTIKMLAFFEAAIMIAGADYKCLIERVRTTQARLEVFGRGDINKAQILSNLNTRYNKKFGMDEAEAVVFALYGTRILTIPSAPSQAH